MELSVSFSLTCMSDGNSTGELKIKAGGGPRSMMRWSVEHEEEGPGVPGVGPPEQEEEVHGA